MRSTLTRATFVAIVVGAFTLFAASANQSAALEAPAAAQGLVQLPGATPGVTPTAPATPTPQATPTPPATPTPVPPSTPTPAPTSTPTPPTTPAPTATVPASTTTLVGAGAGGGTAGGAPTLPATGSSNSQIALWATAAVAIGATLTFVVHRSMRRDDA